jgi:hypothetical protein
MMRRLLFLVAAVLVAACATRAGRSADSAAASAPNAQPAIEAIRPDSVWISSGSFAEVVLRGRGFIPGQPGRNTVLLGRVAFNDVPASDDGKEIRFVIPDRLPSGGEAPPMPIDPGSYTIRVRTPDGESNPMTVRVYR